MGIRSILLFCVFHYLSVDGQVLDALPADFLLIVDAISDNIFLMDISDDSYVKIPLKYVFAFNDIDYDPTDAAIFAVNNSQIISLSIYGDKQTTVRAFDQDAMIVGIALDSASRLLFYTDKGNDVIGVIGLENNLHKTVIRNLEQPGDIVTDPLNGIIYWSEKGFLVDIIEMSNYDGRNRKQLMQDRFESYAVFKEEIVVDVDCNDGVLYWCNNTTLWRVNANESNGELIYATEEEEFSCSIAVYHSNIYFTFGSGIQRIGTDGTGVTVVPFADLIYPTVVHVHTNRSRDNNGCSIGRGGCSHYCFPMPGGSRMCSCPDFMTLLPDSQTCQSSSILLITTHDGPHIYGLDLSNGEAIEILLANLAKPHAISYDPINGTIFWTDTTLHKIFSASVSGSSERVIRHLKINSSPQGIAVDATSRLLFYTDKENGIIAALSLDGSSQKVVIRSKFDEPDAIVTNPINGTIFWTSFGNNGKIEKANYDGTNRQELINTGYVEPSGLAIDIKEGVLYWCIAGGIYKADVNGLTRQLIFKEDKAAFYRIAFYQSYLYVTSSSVRSVMKIGRDEKKPTHFGPATSGSIVDFHFFNGEQIIDRNGCSNASGTCSHFCFPRPGGLKVCACPDGMFLESDGQTCLTSVTSLSTDYIVNTQSDRPPSSYEIDGSSVGLTLLQAAVGSLAGLLVISVLLNVFILRKKSRNPADDNKGEHYATLMTREDEDGQNHTVSEAINNDIL